MSRVLLIETDKPLRDAMADALAAYGYRVDTARDRGEGMKKFTGDDDFDVVIADLHGASDGDWLLAPPGEATRDVPVICISGDRQAAPRDAALEAGASAYLIKPVTAADLHHAIEGALERR